MKFSILFCLIITSLTACGFHLRASYHIPEQLQQLNLNISSASALSAPLRETLQQAHIQLGDGNYTLEVLDDLLNKQTTNTDSRAKAAEYTLYYTVSYQIKDAQNRVVMAERQLLLRRSYQYDTTAIVGKTAEEETLIRELYQDAAQQILRQLSSFKPNQPTTVTP